MAGIMQRASGLYSVRVMIGNERRTLSLGTRSESRARRAAEFIQDLATARACGELPEKETKLWVAKQSSKLRKRLAAAGLIDDVAAQDAPAVTLGAFLRDYIGRYGPAKKAATVTTWKQCERLLLEYFPADKALDSLTPGDAEDFRNYLLTRSGKPCGNRKAKPLAEATVRRRCGCAKGFFAYAVSKGIIPRNPFDNKKVPTTAPSGRQKEFVTPELAQRVLDQFPTAEWRLLFALARWGGMRVPSEPESLRWSDIDFDRMRISFRCPKTEHHDGKDRREIPIFPELVAPLREVFELAEPGEELVLPFLRTLTGTALRKPLLAAITKAQAKPWPKLWNALRASRVTELRESFPAHVVDAWLGHDDNIARKHYAQTLDDHYQRATGDVPAADDPGNPWSALQKCSHFASSRDTHGDAPRPEAPENQASIRNAVHVKAPRWAMRDSNPRHPPCKGGALAN